MDIYTKLEYNEIIQIIQKYCKTYIGKNFCNNLKPSFNFCKVDILLKETMEAVTAIYKNGSPPLDELEPLDIYIKSLDPLL